VYVDLHIQVDPAMSIERAHAIAHQVQQRIHEQVPHIQDVTIHAEPAEPGVEAGVT
jgi:divalent metal cation (Fe/Co/Zn/Cd) transporter